MNKRESAIISAMTEINFGGHLFNEFHKYAEEKLGRPIFTHEMADQEFWTKLKELARPDFIELANNIKD